MTQQSTIERAMTTRSLTQRQALTDQLEELEEEQGETLPAVTCEPWCQYGDGHADASFPDDQHCWSDTYKVDMPSLGLIVGKTYKIRDGFDIYLGKKATHVAARVHLERLRGSEVVELTRTEALALSDALREVAEQLPA
jgi:hypothetical protein